MRRSIALAVFAGLLAFPVIGSAQVTSINQLPDLPRPSPLAETYQRVGLTDLRISYSSPAAREREVWGGLVPWGEVWRAGANAATRLSVSTDFTFGGQAVPAGEYSLFIVPTADSFAFHLNTDSSGRGAYGYVADEDVAVATVTPTEAPARERMLYLFDNTTDSATHLTLDWAGMTAAVEIGVDTAALAQASIDATVGAAWRPHFNAGRYLFENGGDLAQAEGYLTTSIAVQSTWWNEWFMAQVLAGQGQHDRARTHYARAVELGANDATWNNFFSADAEAAVATWPAPSRRRR